MNSVKKHIIISTILCALPLLILLAFYDKLPESVPVHFDSAGNANSFWPRNTVVFGIPGVGILINLAAGFSFSKREDKAAFMFYLIPVIAVTTAVIMLYLGTAHK